MKKNILTGLVLAILLCISIVGSNAQGGSNYSIIGFGDITDANGAYYDGVAGAATAMPSQDHINLANPAMWTYNKNTRLQFGYRFNQNMIESGTEFGDDGNTLYQNNGMVDNFSVVFAIDTALGISAGAGLNRVSDINYYFASPFAIEDNGLGLSGKTYFRGDGGINNAHLGAAFRLFDRISIGAQLGYYFGDIEQSVQTIYDQALAYPTDYYRDIRVTGLNTRLGFDVKATENLNISAYFASDLGLELDNRLLTYTATASTGTNIDTLESLGGTAEMPTRIGLGASYLWDRVRLVGDFGYVMAEGIDFRAPQDGQLRDAFSFSLGAERIPSRFASSRFGERVSYRLGLSYRQLYYQLKGQDIDEMLVSAGISLPLPGTAIIDFGLSLGQRGTLEAGLVQESFLRLNFALSIGDTWFIPFERGYD